MVALKLLICGWNCSVFFGPLDGSKELGVLLLHLTGGISKEVTDVRDYFTQRKTLRSKPANSKMNTYQDTL